MPSRLTGQNIVLTSDFGKVQKASKMASSERVFSMQSFRSLSGITLMFNLSPFDLISVAEVVLRVTKFKHPEWFSANLAFKTTSDEGVL